MTDRQAPDENVAGPKFTNPDGEWVGDFYLSAATKADIEKYMSGSASHSTSGQEQEG